ncbi:hypothetical protein CK203_094366 [Vitis vinifera]|uniref:Uncharacterized protein n=1 Tax=Vitis vinifera TaxID=29760 RepID=A0A438CW67_VITVI|nr:hypothetical protein CK203_094366 [Vitis vinifera]
MEEEIGWCFGTSKEGYGVGPWKAIKNGWMKFSKRVAFMVGNGRRAHFWKDRCLGNTVMGAIRGSGHWNPIFTRHNNDRERREVEALFKRLQGLVLRRDNENVMTL